MNYLKPILVAVLLADFSTVLTGCKPPATGGAKAPGAANTSVSGAANRTGNANRAGNRTSGARRPSRPQRRQQTASTAATSGATRTQDSNRLAAGDSNQASGPSAPSNTPEQITDSEGRPATVTRDAEGNATKMVSKNPDGSLSETTWDQSGAATQVTRNPDGYTSTTTWDAEGNGREVLTYPDGYQRETRWDPNLQIRDTQVTNVDPDTGIKTVDVIDNQHGTASRYTYDSNGQGQRRDTWNNIGDYANGDAPANTIRANEPAAAADQAAQQPAEQQPVQQQPVEQPVQQPIEQPIPVSDQQPAADASADTNQPIDI